MAGTRVPEASRPLPRISPLARRLVDLVLHGVFGGFFPLHVSGLENVPPEGTPALIAANHMSALDLFAAGSVIERRGYFLAKAEATRAPVFGRFLLAVGAVPAQRDGRDTAALRVMLDVLKAGRLLGVAPEGTRSREGRLGPYDPGFLWLASRTGAAVIPCAIHGTWNLMPKGARFPRRGPIWIRFGPAFHVPDHLGRDDLEQRAREVREVALSMLRELVRESGVPNPAVEAAA